MYDDLVTLFGVTPESNPIGFIVCFILLVWFIYQLFSIFYSLFRR